MADELLAVGISARGISSNDADISFAFWDLVKVVTWIAAEMRCSKRMWLRLQRVYTAVILSTYDKRSC